MTLDNKDEVVKKLSGKTHLAIDTETTGLAWKDRIFSVIISDADTDYYFNFNGCVDNEGQRPSAILPRSVLIKDLGILFSNPKHTWIAHHAKFDLRMLRKEGIQVAGQWHCTKSAARVLNNTHLSYSLDQVAGRELGARKDDGVKDYISNSHKLTEEEKRFNNKCKDRARKIKKPKCYKMESVPGKTTRKRKPFFYKVPFNIIVPYGERDSRLTYRLANKQVLELRARPIWEVEKQLPSIVTEMEVRGIKVDVDYCQAAIAHETPLLLEAKRRFCEVAKETSYEGGRLQLVRVFDRFGLKYRQTEKGNPTFKDDQIRYIDHEVVRQLLTVREHEKRLGTYYSSFLYHKDANDFIHCYMHPDGTTTGRFSSSDPNLQNVPKEEDTIAPFYVRKCFVPEKDFIFFMVDYDQQEYRMLLDYADEAILIQEVLQGKDVHQATADLMGVNRGVAKTLNYALLYGVGKAKLGKMLGVSPDDAQSLKDRYFAAMPGVDEFIRTCRNVARNRGFVRTWAGRIALYPEPEFAYKSPNSVIQGGCADVLKIAMIRCNDRLKGFKSHMKLQIHDELLFGLHKDELHLAPDLVEIMENVYRPMSGMKLTCTASWSDKSWGYCDKINGLPSIDKAANL